MRKLAKNNVTVNNANLYAAEYFEVYCVRGVLDHKCQYQYKAGSKDTVWGKIYTSESGYCPKCGKNMFDCCRTSNYDPVNQLKAHIKHARIETVERGAKYYE